MFGQYVNISMYELILRRALSPTTLLSRIEVVPGKRSGKACITGTRITVYDVLSCLAAGMTTAEVIGDYPDLEADDVSACLAYAAAREGLLTRVAA